MHVDERGDEAQRHAVAKILTGRLGGEHVGALPWVRKASELIIAHATSAVPIHKASFPAFISPSDRLKGGARHKLAGPIAEPG